jgi:hypothetical protein
MNRNQIRTARRLAKLADEGGTIQADRLVVVFADPRDHRTMTLREAWAIALPSLSADNIAETLWG